MKLYTHAEEAANDIVNAFQNPKSLPQPLAHVFIHRKDAVPCRSWSWRNQLVAALRGHSDARGFRQWEQVGRYVRKGEKSFRILSPVTKKIPKPTDGEEEDKDRVAIVGFKGVPVFGLAQTDGDPLPATDPANDSWIADLPLIEVARKWGITVEAFNGRSATCLGRFAHSGDRGRAIALGVKNLSTWAHELVHAADHRNGKLKELGQHWRSEIVAELGGATLLTMLGYRHEADLGGCWEYVQKYARNRKLEVIEACGKVLERTCEAVALILDTAESLRAELVEEAVA